MKKLLCLLSLLFSLALAGAGCTEARQFNSGVCENRADCPVGAACRGGLCVCISDEACGPGEECNSQGLCQKLAGCRRNDQCPDPNNTFCDLATGKCIDKVSVDNTGVRSGCGSNVHCDPGYVCDVGNRTCVEGCFEDSDCPLYRVCQGAINGQAGSCNAGTCSDNSFCEYGQLCTAQGCIDSPDRNHCAPCTNQDQNECGGPENFCLINTNYDPNDQSTGSEYYCGVSCEDNPDVCPNGYGCGPVRQLTGDLCETNKHSQCCAGKDPSECCPDGDASGCQNKRVCSAGEGDAFGGCTCLTNEDCELNEIPPRCAGSCGGLGIIECTDNSECLISQCEFTCTAPQGRACTSALDCEPLPLCNSGGLCITDGVTRCTKGADCECRNGSCLRSGKACSTAADCALPCVNGACLVGYSCGPDEGLSCPDVLR